MLSEDVTVLDRLYRAAALECQRQPVRVSLDEVAHVFGTQEPVRSQPAGRAQSLVTAGWLELAYIQVELPEAERMNVVKSLQQAAQAWLKEHPDADDAARKQAHWMSQKTRTYESPQQIVQRVWLGLVLYSLGKRGLAFDAEAQVRWGEMRTGRVGLAPDAVIDIAWEQPAHETYTASFRAQDGTVVRGKGRQRWHVYHVVIQPDARALFERYAQRVEQTVALIVASETYATQPQLPRDFYGGNPFQQACIDAQDQGFDHILVLTPEHGIVSLDDMVPSDQPWDEVLERRIWHWQMVVQQKLGKYLFGDPAITLPRASVFDWWSWLNPESKYIFTIFGGGFAVSLFVESLLNARLRGEKSWPELDFESTPPRPGYIAGGEYGLPGMMNLFDEPDDDEFDDFGPDFDTLMQDIDRLLDMASELVELVNIHVQPIEEFWELAPDEALMPVRLLAESGADFDELLDLLTDMSLLLERSVPFGLIVNANMMVSLLLQITHNLVHDETDMLGEAVANLPDEAVRLYLEGVLQETDKEERLCGCLSLAEQLNMLTLTIPPYTRDQLAVWLQTYLATRMRQQLLGGEDAPDGGSNGAPNGAPRGGAN